MSTTTKSGLSRREFLTLGAASSALLITAACVPVADSGATAVDAGAATAEKAKMSVATHHAAVHDYQREFSQRWAEAHADEVDLQIETVIYGEMPKLQLARHATGTLWDVNFSGIKWFPFSASKGMFMPLDDHMAARDDANLDDFFTTALEGGKLDGVLYGLAFIIHPGNPAVVAINLDMLEAAGFEMPTDDWTVAEFAEMAGVMSDPENNIFGTNYLPGNYYDFESLARAYDTDIMDSQRKEFRFATDELNVEAAHWLTNLRTELYAAPLRADLANEGLDFVSGTIAMGVTGTYRVNGWTTEVGDRFPLDWVLFPLGPEGTRGYTAFHSNFSCWSETAYPDLAVDLLLYLTSTETGLWSALEQGTGQPNARKSVWGNEQVLAQSHPIFERALNKLFLDEDVLGPFPMPYNLRFQELQDNWANTSPDLFYGDVSFEEGLQLVQETCQEIMDLPRA
ncbi:extracellular solute-binding protein [Chloroflexi bacterium TSY]|nr:extracellular solute-binding protein [Chloroflexi bacterium TSY]